MDNYVDSLVFECFFRNCDYSFEPNMDADDHDYKAYLCQTQADGLLEESLPNTAVLYSLFLGPRKILQIRSCPLYDMPTITVLLYADHSRESMSKRHS